MLGLLLRGAFVLATIAVAGAIFYAYVTYLNKETAKKLIDETLKTNVGAFVKDVMRMPNGHTKVTLESLSNDDQLEIEAESVSNDMSIGKNIYV